MKGNYFISYNQFNIFTIEHYRWCRSLTFIWILCCLYYSCIRCTNVFYLHNFAVHFFYYFPQLEMMSFHRSNYFMTNYTAVNLNLNKLCFISMILVQLLVTINETFDDLFINIL